MKLHQAWITLGVLAIAVILFTNITNATLADRHFEPEKVAIEWQPQATPNGK